MCNLYSITRSHDAILRLFRVSHNRATATSPLPAVFPGHMAPVIRQSADERELAIMRWGFMLLQKGRAPRPVTNVRDDTILTSRFWRPSFDHRRCLVPASSYCEPSGERPATWNWFALKGEAARPLFAFPGIWTRYRGPLKKDAPNTDVEVFAFMTCPPNELTVSINHERMPVLLSEPQQFDTWLNGSIDDAFALARPYPADAMRIVQQGADRKDLLGAT